MGIAVQGDVLMEKFKKMHIILALVMVMALLSGCNIVSSRLRQLNEETASTSKSNLETSNSLLDCFSQNDVEGLKALLCVKTQALSDIDEQIQKCFEFFGGTVDSFGDIKSGYEGKSTSYGKTTLHERSWSIHDIANSNGETYEIYISAWIICEEDANREGIAKIVLTRNSDGEELEIGYKWPRHYNDGRDLSVKVVNAFSEHDVNGLTSLLCAKALEIENIDEQIQAAIAFFEGIATKGKIGTRDGRDLYDGNHDYHTSVSDYEIVENYEPVHTSIAVFIENIETDADQVYTIEYYSFLLDADDDSEGISQIIITNNDGDERIIGKKIEPNF